MSQQQDEAQQCDNPEHSHGNSFTPFVQLPNSGVVLDVTDIAFIPRIEINKYGVMFKRPGPQMPIFDGVDYAVLLEYMAQAGLLTQLQKPVAVKEVQPSDIIVAE